MFQWQVGNSKFAIPSSYIKFQQVLTAEHGYDGILKPDVSIFADTGWEPPSMYEHRGLRPVSPRPRSSKWKCGSASAPTNPAGKSPAATNGLPTASRWWNGITAARNCTSGLWTATRTDAASTAVTANGSSYRNGIPPHLPKRWPSTGNCALPYLRKLAPGVAFLHRSRHPLNEVGIAAAPDADAAMPQECEGHCGIRTNLPAPRLITTDKIAEHRVASRPAVC